MDDFIRELAKLCRYASAGGVHKKNTASLVLRDAHRLGKVAITGEEEGHVVCPSLCEAHHVEGQKRVDPLLLNLRSEREPLLQLGQIPAALRDRPLEGVLPGRRALLQVPEPNLDSGCGCNGVVVAALRHCARIAGIESAVVPVDPKEIEAARTSQIAERLDAAFRPGLNRAPLPTEGAASLVDEKASIKETNSRHHARSKKEAPNGGRYNAL